MMLREMICLTNNGNKDMQLFLKAVEMENLVGLLQQLLLIYSVLIGELCRGYELMWRDAKLQVLKLTPNQKELSIVGASGIDLE